MSLRIKRLSSLYNWPTSEAIKFQPQRVLVDKVRALFGTCNPVTQDGDVWTLARQRTPNCQVLKACLAWRSLPTFSRRCIPTSLTEVMSSLVLPGGVSTLRQSLRHSRLISNLVNSQGWTWTSDFPKCWDYRCVPSYWAQRVLEIKPRTRSKWGEYSTTLYIVSPGLYTKLSHYDLKESFNWWSQNDYFSAKKMLI